MITIAKATILMMAVFLMGTVQLTSAAAPAEVQQAANTGLAHFLTTVPASELANMGLRSQEEIKSATLGTPYELFTITPAALNSYKSGMRLSSLISTTNTWMFPVLVNGNPRTMLEVALINGRWEGGSIGGTFLAPRVQEMQNSSARLMGQKGLRSSQNARFVRIFQAQQDFMLFETTSADYLYPMTANPQLNIAGDALYTPEQVVPQLKEVVKMSIESWNERRKKGNR